MNPALDDRSQEVLAAEIGRTFLRAQQMADDIVAEARKKAGKIARIDLRERGLIDPADTGTVALMLRELDEAEQRMTSSQREIAGLLDSFLAPADRAPADRSHGQPTDNRVDAQPPAEPAPVTDGMAGISLDQRVRQWAPPTPGQARVVHLPADAPTPAPATNPAPPIAPTVEREQRVEAPGPAPAPATGQAEQEAAADPGQAQAPAPAPAPAATRGRVSPMRANVIALVVALAVLSVLLVVVNVL